MPEELARALGADAGPLVTIGGKEYRVRPLGLKELTEIERICLRTYKLQYLESYSDNVGVLPDADRSRALTEKVDEAARWDIDDLPVRYVHDASKIVVTHKLRGWSWMHLAAPKNVTDLNLQVLVATALDQNVLTGKEYYELTQNGAPRVKVPYVSWWITGSLEGMVNLIWVCLRGQGVSRSDIENLDLMTLSQVARDIERASAPQPGNG
jgi:hypothetical protein